MRRLGQVKSAFPTGDTFCEGQDMSQSSPVAGDLIQRHIASQFGPDAFLKNFQIFVHQFRP